VGEVHEDKGKSAWDPKVYRKDWQALMARLESGELAASSSTTWNVLRGSSRRRALVSLAERGLLVLDSEGSYDLRKAGDKKHFRDAIVAAEYYSDLLQRR